MTGGVVNVAGELKSEEVLALNPRGQAPTFKDGDIVVNESMAAMQYLEDTYPEVPLLPKGKAERALALQRLHELASLYAAIQPLFYSKMVGKVNSDAEKVRFLCNLAPRRSGLVHDSQLMMCTSLAQPHSVRHSRPPLQHAFLGPKIFIQIYFEAETVVATTAECVDRHSLVVPDAALCGHNLATCTATNFPVFLQISLRVVHDNGAEYAWLIT